MNTIKILLAIGLLGLSCPCLAVGPITGGNAGGIGGTVSTAGSLPEASGSDTIRNSTGWSFNQTTKALTYDRGAPGSYILFSFPQNEGTVSGPFIFKLANAAGSNGETRQDNEFKWGYNVDAVQSGEHQFFESIESRWQAAPGGISQLEHYWTFTNAAGSGYRPFSQVVNLGDDSIITAIRPDRLVFGYKQATYDWLEFDSQASQGTMLFTNSSTLNYTGTVQDWLLANGHGLLGEDTTSHLARIAPGYLGGTIFATANLTGNDATLTFGGTNSRSLRWNHTLLQWEIETSAAVFNPIATRDLAETFSNKTITSPIISNATASTLAKYNGSKVLGSATAGTDYVVNSEQNIADAAATWTTGVTVLRNSTALTADRAIVLPPANAYAGGTVITYMDRHSTTSANFGASFVRAGSDTLNGLTTAQFFFRGPGVARFETDGNAAWHALFPSAASLVDHTNGNLVATTAGAVSAVNTVKFTSAASGSGPSVAADGPASTIGLILSGKGTFAYVSIPRISMSGFWSMNTDVAGGIAFASTHKLAWNSSSTNVTSGTDTIAGDVALGRNAAGVIEVNSNTAGTFRDIKVRTAQSAGTTFANLPTASAGMMSYVTDGATGNCGDSLCTTFGTTVTAGGGSLKLLVWYNGTNWTLIGK